MAHRHDDFEAQQYVNEWSTFDQMEEMGMGLGSNPPSFPAGTNVLNNPLVGGSSGQQQTSESSVIPHGKRAKWWRWFSIEERNINGKIMTKAVCKFCKATLLNDSRCGVSHIKRHGEKCAKDHAPKDPHQTTLTQNEDGQISTFRYNQKAMRIGLAQYIASTELPFIVAECKYFAKFITKYVQPQYVPIIRNTARQDITNLFDQLRLALIHRSLPVLSIMARDILTPPVSSVALEYAFSVGGRVLDERRSRLGPNILEAVVCLKDWGDAEQRAQKWQDQTAVKFSDLTLSDGSSSTQSVFFSKEVEAILSIPLSVFQIGDSLLWHFEENGVYSVRSGYKLGNRLSLRRFLLDMVLVALRVLCPKELELLCVVWWRCWFWRNQKIHAPSLFRDEDVVAWASSFINDFRVANLARPCPSPSSSVSVDSVVKWAAPTTGVQPKIIGGRWLTMEPKEIARLYTTLSLSDRDGLVRILDKDLKTEAVERMNEDDRHRVISGSPWSFDDAFIALEKSTRMIGEVLDIDGGNSREAGGKFMRVRVKGNYGNIANKGRWKPLKPLQVPIAGTEPVLLNNNSNGQMSCMGMGAFSAAENVPSPLQQSTPISIEDCYMEADKMEAFNVKKCPGLSGQSISHALEARKLKDINLGQVGDIGLGEGSRGPQFEKNDNSCGTGLGKDYVNNTKWGGPVKEKKPGEEESDCLG
ncbi:hypothetical protein EZV62_012407 [Acer yangbiense]|uniref:BED-type domain-containing protein n=1 Tax=Acer yangbiense TaxID=1000413 RepID=A0A5C7HW64_9ROSI|nr:hypothetical protein EZV62_012407 [Acer yangbiense]